MKIGINSHPTHFAANLHSHASELAWAGFETVRFPLWRGNERLYQRFVAELHAVGLEALPVFDADSMTPYQRKHRQFAQALAYWRRRFPTLPRLQAGNEPDQDAGDSSWYMSAADFERLQNAAAATWQGAQIIPGGLCKIDFFYLYDDGRPNAAHLYAQDADSVQNLTPHLVRAGKLPIVTEFGSEEPDEHARAAYFSSFLEELWREGYAEVFPYCYSRRQHGTMGLVETDGTQLESFAAVVGAIDALAGDPPPPKSDDPSDFFVHLVAGVQDLIGLPYVFGGRNATTQGGLDCAGFVMEAYHRRGVNLCYVPIGDGDDFPGYDWGKWYTNAQRLYDSPRIPHVSDPQPGDLVYFTRTYNTSDHITHVALVTGDGVLLGAQGERAGYVNYGASAYWRARLVGYGRPQR